MSAAAAAAVMVLASEVFLQEQVLLHLEEMQGPEHKLLAVQEEVPAVAQDHSFKEVRVVETVLEAVVDTMVVAVLQTTVQVAAAHR
jgi:hypothetical protein